MKLSLLRRFSIKSLFKRSVWINPAALMVYSLLAVVTVYTLDVPILELIELKTYDLRFLSRGHQAGMAYSIAAGSAWEPTPWRAVPLLLHDAAADADDQTRKLWIVRVD